MAKAGMLSFTPDWTRFHGVDAPNSTATPDVVFDFIAPFLSDVELRVLLYIIRRTFGFKKAADTIGIEQLVSGIVKKDGTRLDFGTQLSRSGVTKGLRGLREKNLILADRVVDEEHGNQPTRYTLNLRAGGPPIEEVLREVLGIAIPLPRVEQSSATSVASPVPHNGHPSATSVALQQTESRNRITTHPLPPLAGARKQTRRERAEDPAKFARGRYAVCPVCGARPCTAECAAQTLPA
jgi:hypothetical protein